MPCAVALMSAPRSTSSLTLSHCPASAATMVSGSPSALLASTLPPWSRKACSRCGSGAFAAQTMAWPAAGTSRLGSAPLSSRAATPSTLPCSTGHATSGSPPGETAFGSARSSQTSRRTSPASPLAAARVRASSGPLKCRSMSSVWGTFGPCVSGAGAAGSGPRQAASAQSARPSHIVLIISAPGRRRAGVRGEDTPAAAPCRRRIDAGSRRRSVQLGPQGVLAVADLGAQRGIEDAEAVALDHLAEAVAHVAGQAFLAGGDHHREVAVDLLDGLAAGAREFADVVDDIADG